MPGTWGLIYPSRSASMPVTFLVRELSRSARWFDWAGERFRPIRLATTASRFARPRSIPLGRLAPLPTPPPDAFPFLPIMETAMNDRNRKTPTAATPVHRGQHGRLPQNDRPLGRASATRRRGVRPARLAADPTHARRRHRRRRRHPLGLRRADSRRSDAVREFPAHTPGLRQLVAWLTHCGVTTVALEASGVYGHVLFLTLLEAGFHVVTTAPTFTRQIKGRPKTDKRDCQWIQRLHKHGLLPSIFQPDEATQTLRDYVRQRANLVRLSGQHIQRMQKALELMNLKLTKVLGDVTGVTGLKIIRAILAGERDPLELA